MELIGICDNKGRPTPSLLNLKTEFVASLLAGNFFSVTPRRWLSKNPFELIFLRVLPTMLFFLGTTLTKNARQTDKL